MKSPMKEKKVGLSIRALDLFFGYDYFLVHRSADGKEYASALYEALTGKGNELDCFLDVKHYGAGGNLTRMQAQALRKSSRLIVIVTPRAHEADAVHVQNEVNEFRRIHPNRIIAPIGTLQTLSENGYSKSALLPLIPHLPNDICILETPQQMEEGMPSPETVAKLLNDFAEERRSTKRLRWIRRIAALLLVCLLAAIGFAFYAAWEEKLAKQATERANRELHHAQELLREESRRDLALAIAHYLDNKTDDLVPVAAQALREWPENEGASIFLWLQLRQGAATQSEVPLWRIHLPTEARSFVWSDDSKMLAVELNDGRIGVITIYPQPVVRIFGDAPTGSPTSKYSMMVPRPENKLLMAGDDGNDAVGSGHGKAKTHDCFPP